MATMMNAKRGRQSVESTLHLGRPSCGVPMMTDPENPLDRAHPDQPGYFAGSRCPALPTTFPAVCLSLILCRRRLGSGSNPCQRESRGFVFEAADTPTTTFVWPQKALSNDKPPRYALARI